MLGSACSWASQAQPWVSGGPTRTQLLPAWSEESASNLRPALQVQCEKARGLKAPWPALCAELATLSPLETKDHHAKDRLQADRQLLQWINQRFDAWPVASPNGAAKGLLTGYFEPVFNGSLERESPTQVPLYRMPPGLIRGQAAVTREMFGRIHTQTFSTRQVDEHTNTATLRKVVQGRELVWLDDPVDAFFLHIQGSGRVKLRNGDLMRVGYAGNNGHGYVAIGKVLIERGEISRQAMSAQAIRQWLNANPDQADEVMNQNPRYIFFRELPPSGRSKDDELNARTGSAPVGPIGSLGVALTPGRSLATDPRFLPPGALLYLRATARSKGTTKPLARLAVNQDTGSAIRGAVRADLFTGTGDSAGDFAGRLKEPLQLWLLWPKGLLPPGYAAVLRADLDD
ncbi:MAG: murein transglycosylase A [Burkholderiaceae bacterium]